MGTSEGRWKRRPAQRTHADAPPPPPADAPEEGPPFEAYGAGGVVPATSVPGGPGGPGVPSPWPEGGAPLLVNLLVRVARLARSEGRFDLLEQMDRAGGPYPLGVGGFAVAVKESPDAHGHLWAIVRAVETRADPGRALESLRAALRAVAPEDRTVPWLELAALGLAGAAPLDAATVVGLVGALYPVGSLEPALVPTPAQLARHIPRGTPGTHLMTGRETLPEILLRLSDLRAPLGADPLLRFLDRLAADRELAAYDRLEALRGLLPGLHAGAGGPRRAAAQGRLIVQVRVEAVDPEHVEDGRYELRGAYYRQPPDGGPLARLGALPPSGPMRRSELTGAGSARLAAWTDLAREVRGASGGVRVEFLLPTSLLGHRAELWSAGASRTPLGQHHPVVVRSLERYSDPWIDQEPWRRRWDRLCEDPPQPEPLARIAWPPVAELTQWLVRQPELACLGLAVPYDDMAAAIREAVRDALFMEGVPVMVWRRDPGDPDEILAALRPHAPARLRDLPESVHRCRRHGRGAGADDVRNNITLLWDDPDCVDADQDLPYAGMT